ncbi:MAG: TonB-dependent receptor plug domain-containing protein, partial [Bacteroidota bacterium]
MSTQKMDIKTMEKLPAFLGEVDVIKSIQVLPGVSSVGEGSSGFNVRGGSVGQNLVLLDEAPVYNSSHLLGFFSVFNPDAVKDVTLIKGGIPARYGGRIASILDVRMKEGNSKKLAAQGGVGTIFSRLAIEGPLKKDKASFIVAGRRSYADVFAKLFTDVLDDGAALNFWDLTMKANYNINKKNRVYLSGYWGRDVFKFDERQGFNWGNQTLTARWNHLFNDRLFSNFTFFFSDYDYELAFGDDDLDKFDWNSRIRNYDFKPEFTYYANQQNKITFGGEALFYEFEPANAVGVSNGEARDITIDEKNALETSLYLANQQKIGTRLEIQYGLRFSNFLYLGPSDYYTFDNPEAGERRDVVETFSSDRWEVIDAYRNFEPRLAINFQLNESSSLKASYNRTAQYIHLVSNTTASNPLDVWTPST